uniref:Uncharacterized protein n=1 Tax=Rangifer tarandus platyrhynchus TaxID=3082113 RepID=A0ACB0EMF3_RANTA|nr:unnamed protein product [Rangifer tarandus platyrhynchus]
MEGRGRRRRRGRGRGRGAHWELSLGRPAPDLRVAAAVARRAAPAGAAEPPGNSVPAPSPQRGCEAAASGPARPPQPASSLSRWDGRWVRLRERRGYCRPNPAWKPRNPPAARPVVSVKAGLAGRGPAAARGRPGAPGAGGGDPGVGWPGRASCAGGARYAELRRR